ncbi:unnamed protein product [Camellia sinensis]
MPEGGATEVTEMEEAPHSMPWWSMPESSGLLEEWDKRAVDVRGHDSVYSSNEFATDEDDRDGGGGFTLAGKDEAGGEELAGGGIFKADLAAIVADLCDATRAIRCEFRARRAMEVG